MTLPLLYVYIIMGILYQDYEDQQNQAASVRSLQSTISGDFYVTCICNSILSDACANYTCTNPWDLSYVCFAGRSQVTLPDGHHKQLSQLQIGDLVMVNENNAYEPILTFIHANKQQLTHYLAIDIYSIVSNMSSTLLVSPNHLIFDYDSGEARFAGKFHVGDRVQFIYNNRITSGEIMNIRLSAEQGYYAPLTRSGTIVIDGVVASNYASVNNHVLAHRVMGLYRWWIKMVGVTPNEDIPWMLYIMSYVEQIIRWCGLNV